MALTKRFDLAKDSNQNKFINWDQDFNLVCMEYKI